jgi:nicotinamidase-related amidase
MNNQNVIKKFLNRFELERRKKMKKIVFIVLIISIISCKSNNVKISDYENPQKALLVIDMQIDYIGENGKFTIEENQIENLIGITNKIIDEYYNNNYKVIYLKNIFRKNDFRNRFRNYAAIEGAMGTEIDPRINIVSENIFKKYTPTAFSNNDFELFLIENQINELFLCGVMADQCVYETAISAHNKGYIVNYFSNAVGSLSVKNIRNAIRKLNKKGINIIEY